MNKYNLIFLLGISFTSIFGNCNKKGTNSPITVKEVNLKTKTILELKIFLNGNWQLIYAWKSTIAGRTKEMYENANNIMKFYPVDSLLWTTSNLNTILSKGKAIYTWSKSANPTNDSAFNISFPSFNGSFSYNWTADKTLNDTLIFVDNSMVGSSYYFIRR